MTENTRPWLAVGLLALLPVLAACAAAEPDTVSQPPGDDAPPPPAASVELPCGAADAAELEAIFGSGFGDGRAGSANVTENDVTWTPDSCTWQADGIEMQLRVAEAADFEGGFVCLEPIAVGRDLEPVSGVGDQAWWEFTDRSGAEGELRVCTGDTLVEVLVDAESGESASLRDQAIEVGELVISRL
ncbi:MAG: hypothetical protein Q7J04_05365 [Microcella sp.]|nr:hypothetical protein [Microcella sp.]